MAGHKKKNKATALPQAPEPQWRKDFPIDVVEDNFVARRDFTKFMVLISFAFVFGQFWIGAQNWVRRRRGKPAILEIAREDELAVGAAKTFHYPGPHDSCLLIRLGPDTFAAYGDQCTHLMCAVRPQFEKNSLHCPCHSGYFDLATGRAIAGPPRRPLPRVHLLIQHGIIYATDFEVRTT